MTVIVPAAIPVTLPDASTVPRLVLLLLQLPSALADVSVIDEFTQTDVAPDIAATAGLTVIVVMLRHPAVRE